MFKCTIWLDAACLSSTLCEWGDLSSLSNLRHPHLICRKSRVRPITRKTEGSLTPKAHANWAASVITHQLSLKGKAAADVAEVAKHLNITYDVRDAENAAESRMRHIMEFIV